MYRIYISASTQKNNTGVGQYGTEQDRMMHLADRVKYWLETQKGKFVVFRNLRNWTLAQTVKDCNSLACELIVDNHTNAGAVEQTAGDGGAEGTEVFYNHNAGINNKGRKIANLLYKYIAPISPGKDRGVLPDNRYVSSLFVIQNTIPPASLIEHIFHTNYDEVADLIGDIDKYAIAEAKAICEYFGETWIVSGEPSVVIPEPVPQNASDDNVKAIQALCNLLGCRDNDGKYLGVDGKAGPKTISAIRKLPVIKQGSNSKDAVKVIQGIVGVAKDGGFGPLTLAAVKKWQMSNGLDADGIVGPMCWAKMAKIN